MDFEALFTKSAEARHHDAAEGVLGNEARNLAYSQEQKQFGSSVGEGWAEITVGGIATTLGLLSRTTLGRLVAIGVLGLMAYGASNVYGEGAGGVMKKTADAMEERLR